VLLLMLLLAAWSLDEEDVVVSGLQILVKRAESFIPGQNSGFLCSGIVLSICTKATVLSIWRRKLGVNQAGKILCSCWSLMW